MVEKPTQSSDMEHGTGTTAHGSESEPATSSDCLSNSVDLASLDTLGDRTDSKTEKQPVEQESEQDSSILQQLESGEVGSVPAVSGASKLGLSSGLVQRQGRHDGEEKRDQSKEEPPLEINTPEGWLFSLYNTVVSFQTDYLSNYLS